MAYSYAITVASGSTDLVAVPFAYLSRAHVHVTLDGEAVDDGDLTWISDSQIQLPSTPTSGVAVKVYRATPADGPLVEWPGRSVLSSADLNKAAYQNLYIAQEASDGASISQDAADAILVYLDGITDTYNAVVALADAASSDADDAAAAKTAAETAQGGAETAQGASEAARDLAEGYKDAALAAQGGAETAQGLAETAQGASEAARDAAEGFKDGAEAAQAAAEAAADEADAEALLTTRGDIPRRGASGAERLALGTAGYPAGSDGTDFTYLTPWGWEPLGAEATAADAATVDFTGIGSTYRAIMFVIDNWRPHTSGEKGVIRLQKSGSFDSGANYDDAAFWIETTAGTSNQKTTGGTYGRVTPNLTNGTSAGFCGVLLVINPATTAAVRWFATGAVGTVTSGGLGSLMSAGKYTASGPITGVRFMATSGNVDIASIRAYGLR